MKILRLVLFWCLVAAGSKAEIPDSPAGDVFTKWLGAFNKDDRAGFQRFLEKYWPDRTASKIRTKMARVGWATVAVRRE
jgi:hypothetical protein